MSQMTGDPYLDAIEGYSEDRFEATSRRLLRFARRGTRRTVARMETCLEDKDAVTQILSELESADRDALCIFSRVPRVAWRWDHAVRLLFACGVPAPYHSLQRLLDEGLLAMRAAEPGTPISRFQVADGIPAASLPRIVAPSSFRRLDLDWKLPLDPIAGKTATRWRQADGWDFPLRLALLWRLTWRMPLKRTQQGQLFKRDLERIGGNALLASPPMDTPENVSGIAMLSYVLACRLSWLGDRKEEQEPTAPLTDLLPESLAEFLEQCAAQIVCMDEWNELEPTGTFAGEVPSARMLLLLLLSTLSNDEGATVEELSARLARMHPPWSMRTDLSAGGRSVVPDCMTWTRHCLLGPLYQCGMIAVAEAADVAANATLVRLTASGRTFLGTPIPSATGAEYPITLLVQPNHEIIVYRQGLTNRLLGRLFLFAKPKSLGAALSLELDPESVYHGLEAGMEPRAILELLTQYGGREPPPSVAQSIRTWAQKRERVCVYNGVSLFEFANQADLLDAQRRGLEGVAITDNILVVAGQNLDYRSVRITSSRDYQLSSEPCVMVAEDGVTLLVDLAKSDLLLDSELARFADRDPSRGTGCFRVSKGSIQRALEQGLSSSYLEQWFRDRTGSPPPASTALLLVSDPIPLAVRERIVVYAPHSAIIDGLMQHPLTAIHLKERLGPTAVAVEAEHFESFREACAHLGVVFDGTPAPNGAPRTTSAF